MTKIDENWILYIAIALAVFMFIGPQSELFATITLSPETLNVTPPCPEWSYVGSPCEGAVWLDKPNCVWDISGCKDYCESDADCREMVPAPNDCSLFWEPYDIPKIGICQYNFCNWQEVPPPAQDCTGAQLFLQKYKWIMAGIVVVLLAWFLAEKDIGGKKRGFL